MTTSTEVQQSSRAFFISSPTILIIVAVVVLAVVAFWDGLRELAIVWETREEYSFGFMVPFVSGYLVWQRRTLLTDPPRGGSWLGVVMMGVALLLLFAGRTAMILTFVQYAFLLAIFAMFLAYFGTRGFARMAMPLALLIFMVPLPAFFLGDLSQQMQLWSSKMGVALIRLTGISVYLEGNVIDLGLMKLQVVEACSGLRYLFPLLTLAFIAASLFRAGILKRTILVLSAIPITVFMNSARIAMIGILVQFYGKSMAEGFLHDFEGWVVFLICTAILVAEMALLARLGSHKARLSEMFSFDAGEAAPVPAKRAQIGLGDLPRPFLAAGILVAAAVVLSVALPAPQQVTPIRKPFADFPMAFGDWHGRPDVLGAEYLSLLKLDDYILADYAGSDPLRHVNLYASYYASQINGVSAHSPRACIPGDGWEITEFRERELPSVPFAGKPAVVNRAVIRKGETRNIVYYWFQQRGRITTDEYAAKFYIFLDALTRHRTDGAMVRLVADTVAGQPDDVADRKLESFAGLVVPEFARYIPD